MGKRCTEECKLIFMSFLTGSYFLVELIVGYATGSTSLVADAFHMLSDAAALIVALVSLKMAPKRWDRSTFGWARAEVLGALINAVFLMALCYTIFLEALEKIITPTLLLQPVLIIYVGSFGLVVNAIGLFMFTGHSGHGHTPEISTRGQQPLPIDDDVLDKEVRIQKERYHASHEIKTLKDHDVKRGSTGSMNIKGVYLHILADLLASIIVIISALIIWLTNWPFRNYVDPTLSIIVVILILYSIWPLLKDSSLIMLQNVPAQVKMTALEKKLIREVEEVISIHEFHVWQLTEDRIIATAHIVCRNLNEYINVAAKVKEFFHNEGIHSTTIQPEFVEEKIEECAIECPSVCAEQKCCVTYDDPIEEELPKELTANK